MAPRPSKIEPLSWRKLSENTKQSLNQIEWIQKTKYKIKRTTESLSNLTNINIDDKYTAIQESPARNTRSCRRQSMITPLPIYNTSSNKAIKKMRSLTRVTGEVIRQVSQTTYIILYDYYIIDYFNIIILIFKYCLFHEVINSCNW